MMRVVLRSTRCLGLLLIAASVEAGIIESESTLMVSALRSNAPGGVIKNSVGLDAFEPHPVGVEVFAGSETSGSVGSRAEGWVRNSIDRQSAGGQAFFDGYFNKFRQGIGAGYYSPGGGIRQTVTLDSPSTVQLAVSSANESLRYSEEGDLSTEFTSAYFSIYRKSNGDRVRFEQLSPAGGRAAATLDAGEYEIVIDIPDNGNISYASRGGASGFAQTSVLWGVGALPGSTPDVNILSTPVKTLNPTFESETIPINIPEQVSGAFLTRETAFHAPVQGEFGTTERIHFEGSELAAAAAVAGAVAEASSALTTPLGYYFITLTDSPLFASFSLTDIASDQAYNIFFEGTSHVVLGDDIFDFTVFNPNGVSNFFVSGLDSYLGNGIPYTFSTTFVEEGTAQFVVGSIVAPASTAVPEPSTLALLGVGGSVGAGNWLRRRRKVSRQT